MIRAATTDAVTPHVKKRSATMTVERLGPTEFRVTPSEDGKLPRIVRFFIDGTDCAIDCADEDGNGCPANDHGRHCSHAQCAITMLLKQNEE